MRKLLALLAALLGAFLWQSPAFAQEIGPSPIYCNSTYSVSGQSGPIAQTRIVQNNGSQTISMCGWNIANTGGAAVTISFQSGTGTNCGTNTVVGTTAVTVGNGAQNIDHDPVASFSIGKGQDLCWTVTGTGNINAVIFFGAY
jgi:hypothetical protein